MVKLLIFNKLTSKALSDIEVSNAGWACIGRKKKKKKKKSPQQCAGHPVQSVDKRLVGDQSRVLYSLIR